MKRISAVLILGIVICACIGAGCISPSEPGAGTGKETPPGDQGDGNTPASSVARDELYFVTEEYPPYNYVEDGMIQGIGVDLLRGVIRRMDSTVSSDNIRVLPWSRAYEIAQKENNTAIFATVRLPEREDLFKWAGPLGSERKVIFADTNSGIVITGPGDLDRYRIGVVRDDAAYTQLLALGVDPSNLVAMGTVPALLSLMEEGAIDLWCYGDLAGRYYARTVTGDPSYYKVVYTLDSEDLYYAFNKNTSDETVGAFQGALDTLRYEPDATGITEYQRIVYRYTGVSCLPDSGITAEQVTGLVNLTAGCIEEDAPGTLARINAGEDPFWDRNNRALYVFVYDTDVTIVAEADNPRLIGVSMKGKTDVAGTPFRDLLTQAALSEGSGWVDYVWMVPEENGIYEKSAYCRLVEGSDGNRYIVVSGMYTPCDDREATPISST